MGKDKKIAGLVLVISLVGIILAFLPQSLISLYWKIGLVSSAIFIDFYLVSLTRPNTTKGGSE